LKTGANCVTFAAGVICNHTTPTTPTTHPDQTRPQEAHPDQTPTKGTAAGAILEGHHRPTPEAAEPPRPKNDPTRHPDKRQQEQPEQTGGTTKGRTEAPRQDTRQISPRTHTTDPTTARPDRTRRNGNKPQGRHHKRQRGSDNPDSKPATRTNRTPRPATTPKADKEHPTKDTTDTANRHQSSPQGNHVNDKSGNAESPPDLNTKEAGRDRHQRQKGSQKGQAGQKPRPHPQGRHTTHKGGREAKDGRTATPEPIQTRRR